MSLERDLKGSGLFAVVHAIAENAKLLADSDSYPSRGFQEGLAGDDKVQPVLDGRRGDFSGTDSVENSSSSLLDVLQTFR